MRILRSLLISVEPDAENNKKYLKFHFGIVIANLDNILKLMQNDLNFLETSVI